MKKLFSLALVLAVGFGAAGCSPVTQTPAPQSPSPAPSVSAPAAPSPSESASPSPSASQPAASVKTMKIGSTNAKDRAPSQGFYSFQKYLEAECKTIKVEVYTDGVLGDDTATLEGLQMGTIQGSTVSTSPIAALVPSIGVFGLPFLFSDKETAYKVLDGPVGQEELDALSGSGIIGLCYWENGWRHITNSKRPIKTLADLKGLKIRVMNSPIEVDTWTALGTNPTPLDFSQLYTALEQKVVDGQENPLGNVVTKKFNEVQKYLTLSGHEYSASPFLVSKVFWDSCTPDEQAAIKDAALKARDDERVAAQNEDKTATQTLTAAGMQIDQLNPGEKDKMRAAVQPIYDKYGAKYGKDLMDKLAAAMK